MASVQYLLHGSWGDGHPCMVASYNNASLSRPHMMKYETETKQFVLFQFQRPHMLK
jgi:hypothetical protein